MTDKKNDAMDFTISAPQDDAVAIELPKEQMNVPTDDERVMQKLPQVDADTLLQLDTNAQRWVSVVGEIDPSNPDFSKKVDAIYAIGTEAFHSTTDATTRFLEQSISTSKSEAQERVSTSLADLRNMCDELAPEDESFGAKVLGFLPFGNSIKRKAGRYLQRYESNKKQLDEIVAALDRSKGLVQKDNAAITVECRNLWEDMIELQKAYALLSDLDAHLTAEIAKRAASGDEAGARALEQNALFACRQRRMDVVTQSAVTVQAYLNMQIIQTNNKQIVRSVERAKTTTLTALRTAVVVAQGLENQKRVLDQVDAVNAETNRMIEYTAGLLQDNSSRTWQQATSTGVSAETLGKAFDAVFQTLDNIDTYKAQATKIMGENIQRLDEQMTAAKQRLAEHMPENASLDSDELLTLPNGVDKQ